MADDPVNKPDPSESNFRNFLSLGITTISILGVLTIAGVILWRGSEPPQQLLGTILPVIGTWVGTILAYYYSKENLEAATRSITSVARQMTASEKLKSLPVTQKMIPKAEIFFQSLPASGINLLQMLAALDAAKKGSRIPILDDKGCPAYVIHRSAVDRYLVRRASEVNGPKLDTLTLEDMLSDSDIKSALDKSFVTVNETATLADAKAAMDQISVCQDVFVTKAGTRNEPVLGWITNAIIEDNAKV
jgi:hypothetical protein